MWIHSSFKLLNPYRSVLILTRDLHPQAVGHRHLTAIFIFITASLSWPSTYITPSSQIQAPDSSLYHRVLIQTRDLHPQAVRHRHLAAICSLSQCPYPDQGTYFKFGVALRPQRPYGLIGTGIQGQPPRLSHSSSGLKGPTPRGSQTKAPDSNQRFITVWPGTHTHGEPVWPSGEALG